MLRTILFGSALLACLVAGRLTAQQPDLVATPVPTPAVAPITAAAPAIPAARAYFTTSHTQGLPSHAAASTGL